MSSIFDRLAKRSAFPLDIDGVVIHITEPTMGQISRIQKLDVNDATGLAFGLCLVDSNGVREFSELDGETDEGFSRRIMAMTSNCTVSTIKEISKAILRLAKPVEEDTLIKN